MLEEISRQELVVAALLYDAEYLAEVADAKFEEWSLARTLEQKAFDEWLAEHRLLSRMKEANNDAKT